MDLGTEFSWDMITGVRPSEYPFPVRSCKRWVRNFEAPGSKKTGLK